MLSGINRKEIRSFVGAGILATVLLMPTIAEAQNYTGSPVTKPRLVAVLRSKSLQTRDIVKIVSESGTDFQLTPDIETELVAAGARPQVIEAVRANYRAPVAVQKPISNPVSNKSTGNTKIAAGAPLSKEAVMTLLQNGVADVRVQQNVKQRGISFQMNAKIAKEIKDEGGSDALVGVMFTSFIQPNSAEGNDNSIINASSKTAPKGYDALVDQAVDLYDNQKDKRGAVEMLQKAVALDGNNPRAYQLLGFMSLYGMQNLADAEKYMNESLARGGSAVFRVMHDHNGTFTDTCNGSLYIAKDTVRFESDDNKHTFDTPDSNIKSVKMNSSLVRLFQIKPGSYKIVLKSGENKGLNFNFAPNTGSSEESKLVIRLIGKN